MAGRPRKPVALKKLEGTYRKDRNPDNPVELPAELPTKPDWVDHDAIAAGMYEQVAKHLHTMGVSTEVDNLGIGLLSDQLSIYLKARAEVLSKGPIIKTYGSTGQEVTKENPAITVMNKAYANITKMMGEMGLTPAARAKLDADKPIEVNSFESFLKQ